MTRWTQARAVTGSVTCATSLGLPSLATWLCRTTTRLAPAARSMAPPMPVMSLPGTVQFARSPVHANWTVPGKLITGMGGAMELAAGAKRVVVLQSHVAKDGKPKLVAEVTLPLTALACVHRVITELGVFDVCGDHFVCVERAPGVGDDEIRRGTGAVVRFGF